MISIERKEKCCGCGSCAQICNAGCIRMEADAEGFLYPSVDKEKCVNCKACEKVCPITHNNGDDATDGVSPYAIGGWNEDKDVRQDSSSGGVFSLLAEAVLDAGGVVYGCALDEQMRAGHRRVERKEELNILRGSKYVQSEIGDAYINIRRDLREGRKVLFVGTPCQAAGLRAYLGDMDTSDLYEADFICHGVPSPRVFGDYIRSEETRHGGEMISFRFRNKDRGWSQTGLQLGTLAKYKGGNQVRKYPAFMDPFMNAFLEDVCLRPSCHECSFKTMPKDYADFTMADFWGVNKVNKELNDGRGTSLLLIHSDKGRAFWESVSHGFHYKEVGYEESVRRNKPLTHSARRNPKRKAFFEDYGRKGFEYVRRKYMSAFVWAWHRSEQLIKFALVGCSNTIISLAVYYIMHGILGAHYLAAYTLGFLVSVCNAFYWNNKYVFRDKQEASLIKAFIKLVASYGTSFLLSLVLMGFMVELLRIPSLIAPVLKLAVTIPLNFVLNKLWVFKDKKI